MTTTDKNHKDAIAKCVERLLREGTKPDTFILTLKAIAREYITMEPRIDKRNGKEITFLMEVRTAYYKKTELYKRRGRNQVVDEINMCIVRKTK